MDKKVKMGLLISGIAALTALLANSSCREKVCLEVTKTKRCVTESISFIRENREQILSQIQVTANEISNKVQTITNDINELTNSVNTLKEDSLEVIDVTKKAINEIKKLK